MNRTAFPVPALLAFCLLGCTAHYRQSLEAYRKAEPVSFAQKTLEWASAADETPAPNPGAEIPIRLQDAATTPSQEVFLEMAARLFDRQPAALKPHLEALESPEGIRHALNETVRLENLLPAVALYNPSVRAAQNRWEAMRHQYSQADFLDALIRQYRGLTRYLMIEAGSPLHQEMEQDFFPYPSVITLKGEMIRQEVRMAELEWEAALRDAALTAGERFFSYQYLARAEVTAAENVNLSANLLDVVDRRYRAGTAAQADLISLQTELERRRNMLQDIRAQKESAVAAINALLNRSPEAPLGPPETADLPVARWTLAALTDTALARRQEVNIQEARLRRADAAIRMGEVMNRPLATQGYSLFGRGMMPEASPGEPRKAFGLEPNTQDRPAFAQAEAYLAEMRRHRDAEEALLHQAKAETRAMAKIYLQNLDAARRKDDLVRQVILPQSRSAYEISLSAYIAGEASFRELLEAERALLDARIERDEVRRTLNQTLLQVATIRGFLSF